MKKHIHSIILLLTILVYSLFSKSCGNTSGGPTGGDKDTLPPILVSVTPLLYSTDFPLAKQTIRLTFDEYVVLKDAATNIYISPPTGKRLQTSIKGKGIQITFQDTLRPNTTYNIELGNAVVDNNEGNIFPGYSYTFSTGSVIDSLYTTGTVNNYKTMLPVKRATIAFYTSPADSAVLTTLPDAIAKSDDWGFFTARNLKDTTYYIYAFEDQNNNNKYDPDNETIAFLDSIFVPMLVMNDKVHELGHFDVKDTAACMKRDSYMSLSLFEEMPSRQFVENRARTDARSLWIKFSAPNVIIDTLHIDRISNDKLIQEFNIQRDSLSLWINDQSAMPDTLHLAITYHATDSTGKLSPLTENFKMPIAAENKQSSSTTRRRTGYDPTIANKDTTLKFTLTAEPENIEQNGFILDFNLPLIHSAFDSIGFWYINPMMQRKNENITITRDTANIRRYIIRPENPLASGNDYNLRIPSGIFTDINGFKNDSLVKKVSLPTDETLSTLVIDAINVNNNYIIELLNEKRDKVIRTYNIKEDSKLSFPYLKADKYSIRITEDKNGNGILDTGSLLERRQPEKVIMYRIGTGMNAEAYMLEIGQREEILKTIDLEELFK